MNKGREDTLTTAHDQSEVPEDILEFLENAREVGVLQFEPEAGQVTTGKQTASSAKQPSSSRLGNMVDEERGSNAGGDNTNNEDLRITFGFPMIYINPNINMKISLPRSYLISMA